MTVDVLLGQLSAAGVVLSVDGDRLLFDAPAGALTPDLRAGLAAHRAELIRRLSAPGTSTPIATPPRRCPGHIDPRQWVDWSPLHGRILTTCQLCGGFIGYRPAPAQRMDEQS